MTEDLFELAKLCCRTCRALMDTSDLDCLRETIEGLRRSVGLSTLSPIIIMTIGIRTVGVIEFAIGQRVNPARSSKEHDSGFTKERIAGLQVELGEMLYIFDERRRQLPQEGPERCGILEDGEHVMRVDAVSPAPAPVTVCCFILIPPLSPADVQFDVGCVSIFHS